MKKWFSLNTKITKIYHERGFLGLFFSPGDYLINLLLKCCLNKKTILQLNAVDVYLRYNAVSKKITKSDKKIIEVGAAYSALPDFLTKEQHSFCFVDTDKSFNPEKGIAYYCVEGTSLPFPDKYFDCLVSVATLEHIPREQRDNAVAEWKRVASHVIVYVPFGENGKKYDKKLYALRQLLGWNDRWTEEHIRYGLPTREELQQYFPSALITSMENGKLWLLTVFISSIPVFGRILPGFLYLFLKPLYKQEEFITCLIDWKQ